MRLYIHTIDGRPAYFDGEQLVFAELRDHWQDDYSVCVACTTLAQVRGEQARSLSYRKTNGFDSLGRYDFVIVDTAPSTIKWRGEAAS